MRQLLNASSALALVMGLVLTSSIQAQVQPKDNKVQFAQDDRDSGRIHTMVIQNGTTRSVHFFTNSTSPSEQQAVRDLERAEAEASYADSLLALRQQYVANEKLLEPRRSQMQQWYYGTSTNINRSDYINSGNYGWGGYGGLGGYAGLAGFGWGGLGGYRTYGGPSFGAADTVSVSNGVSQGIGPEGTLKEAMASVIAGQANPQYASNAYQNANTVAVAALGKRGQAGNPVVPVKEEKVEPRPRTITAFLKDGSKMEGTSYREEGQWLAVIKKDGESLIPRGNVTRIEIKFAK